MRSRARRQEVTLRVDDAGPVGLDRVEVAFDDEKVVSDAGIALVATLASRLGIERLVDRMVLLPADRPGAVNAGRKVLGLLFSMVLGGDCIDDAQVLRSGRTIRLLGWIPAPSTLGTFLRAFTFGHVRQLEKVLGECLTRAWAAGAGPGRERLVIDVDSFIGEVHGYQKQGAGFGYTRVRGLHPILASRAGTGEVLQIRLRKGAANTQRGILRFTNELIARVNRTGATGVKLLRADSGFWNLKVFKRLEAAGWEYSIGIRMTKGIQALVEQIPESAWTRIEDYPQPGEAQIAETRYGTRRLIVRRVRALPNAQSELFPAWFHYPFATNRTDPIAIAIVSIANTP
jgi:Transposase DDE domain group 1